MPFRKSVVKMALVRILSLRAKRAMIARPRKQSSKVVRKQLETRDQRIDSGSLEEEEREAVRACSCFRFLLVVGLDEEGTRGGKNDLSAAESAEPAETGREGRRR